jgi:hypothetical protein
MEFLPLSLFPQGSLASSVITTVWIGVIVVVFFNLRFGWVLSGLVVPGYLVPLLIIKPWSAAIIILESILTYFLVWFISEILSRLGYWSQLFGRDRFFALVVISVLVRVLFDGWLLPSLGEWVVGRYDLAFDYRNNLHSFGLIIVALIANQFWKSGFRMGLVPLAGNLVITYLIVRYGLMEFTNFTVSNLNYMYEDIASSILASPKSYIILITTAFVASRMNLHYGWDFSGIMIPSLLALQWYQPFKILASFFEALLILGIAHLLLNTKLFKNVSIEGGRKLLLFFNIGFVYKLFLGYLILLFLPDVKVTDSYAFGYLLATLMAIKMHDKDIAVRLTRATLQTSLVGVAVASLIGFTLTLLPEPDIEFEAYASAAPTLQLIGDKQSMMDIVREDQVRLYQPQSQNHLPVPLALELERFSDALKQLRNHLHTGSTHSLQQALIQFQTVGYELLYDNLGYYYLREQSVVRGWGLYLIRSNTKSRMIVEIPAPLDERGTLAAGLQAFALLDAHGLAVAGSSRYLNPDRSADVLTNPQSFFQVFHSVFAKQDVLQVRGYTRETSRLSAVSESDYTSINGSYFEEPENTLWVHVDLPPGLDLSALKTLTGTLNILWRAPPIRNRQRELSRNGFAELLLNQHGIRSIQSQAAGFGKAPPLVLGSQRIDGYLQDWIQIRKDLIAEKGCNCYVAPQIEELLFFDSEVVTPLLRISARSYHEGEWTRNGLDELQSIQAAAAIFNYRLIRYRHRVSHEDFLILAEADSGTRRYWGTYVFRLSKSNNYLVQVPRPLYELNSFEYGISLYQRLHAKVLLLSGSHPGANTDGSADLIRLGNVVSLFSLVNQAVLREADDTPLLVIHSRALGHTGRDALRHTDALITKVDPPSSRGVSDMLIYPMLELLNQEGISYRFVEGDQDTAYELGSVAQSFYINAARNKGFVALWLSPRARSVYHQQDQSRQEQMRFNAVGIETLKTDLYDYLNSLENPIRLRPLSTSLQRQLSHYLDNGNVVALNELVERWPDYTWIRLIDLNSHQSFLIGSKNQVGLSLLANLNPRHADSVFKVTGSRLSRNEIQHFIDSRKALLKLQDEL